MKIFIPARNFICGLGFLFSLPFENIFRVLLVFSRRLNLLSPQNGQTWGRKGIEEFIFFLFLSSFVSFSAPCALLKCDFYAKCEAQLDGSLECVCPKQCPLSLDPVCGSDVKSYPNECTLQVESCRTKTRITVAKRGQCGTYS